MKRGTMYLVIMAGIMVLLLAFTAGWNVDIPNYPPTTPGDNPPITVTTTVTVVNPWNPFGQPYIDKIDNQIGNYAQSKAVLDIEWLKFVGKLELKVVAPNGNTMIVGEKDIHMDWGATKTFTFVWKTKQRGKHIVIATLYDEQGHVLDEKQVEFVVPGEV